MLPRFDFCLTLLAAAGRGSPDPALAADAIPAISRVLPPEGLEIPADIRSRLETRLAVTKKRLEGLTDAKQKPDVEIFTKAVDLALIHRGGDQRHVLEGPGLRDPGELFGSDVVGDRRRRQIDDR